MNSAGNEGMTLAKWAVSASLCVLLIGAIATWYFAFSDKGTTKLRQTEDTVRSVSMDKLYTLQDQSVKADNTTGTIGEHPLVSAVSAALLEHAEQDMLYVYITCKKTVNGLPTYSGSRLFTYNNVTFVNGTLNGLPGYSSGITYYYGDTILSEAGKYIQQWSAERCHLHITSVPYSNDVLTGIGIEVLED